MRNVWAFDPREGSRHIAIWIADVREYDFILERGYATLDGVKAIPDLSCCERAVGRAGESFLRLTLEQDYMRPEVIAVEPDPGPLQLEVAA
jgi:hypothetical protein